MKFKQIRSSRRILKLRRNSPCEMAAEAYKLSVSRALHDLGCLPTPLQS